MSLSASTSGGSGLTFQWYKDGLPITGATSPSHLATSTGTHSFNCRVKGPSCSVGVSDSDDTVVTWQGAPSFAGLKWVTATSDSSCGLHLEWDAGTSPKDAGGLVYNVYRSKDRSKPFRSEEGGHRSFCMVEVMYNEARCHTCHDPGNDVVGVLEVCLSIAKTEGQIAHNARFMMASKER